MGARLFLLRERIREGSRFLRCVRFQRRTAAAAFTAALSVSRRERISGRCATSRLSTRVQHTAALRPAAAELELSLSAAEVRRRQSHCTCCQDFSCALFAMASQRSSSSWPVWNVGNVLGALKLFFSMYS